MSCLLLLNILSSQFIVIVNINNSSKSFDGVCFFQHPIDCIVNSFWEGNWSCILLTSNTCTWFIKEKVWITFLHHSKVSLDSMQLDVFFICLEIMMPLTNTRLIPLCHMFHLLLHNNTPLQAMTSNWVRKIVPYMLGGVHELR